MHHILWGRIQAALVLSLWPPAAFLFHYSPQYYGLAKANGSNNAFAQILRLTARDQCFTANMVAQALAYDWRGSAKVSVAMS